MRDLQDVQNEHIYDELGQDYHRGEQDVVLQVTIADFIVLGDLGLVSEVIDEEKGERYHEQGLCLAGIGVHWAEKSFKTFTFLTLELEALSLLFVVLCVFEE